LNEPKPAVARKRRQKSMADDSDLMDDEEVQTSYDAEVANIPASAAKISELCKYIWAGSLAFFYATLSSGRDTIAHTFYIENKCYILATAVFASIALIADYIQNLCGLKHAETLTEWIENTEIISRAQYNAHTSTVYSRLNTLFFYLKNVCCIVAALLIMCSIISFISH
jgi:hypothetical protein